MRTATWHRVDALSVILCSAMGIRAAETPAWVAAYIEPGAREPSLTAFSAAGARFVVPLPDALLHSTYHVFGLDGGSLYIETPHGVVRTELKTLRETIIPGTSGFSSIWSLRIVEKTGRVIISGMSAGECGSFEVDPAAGSRTALLAGAYPVCGGGGGVPAPDGRLAVRHLRGSLQVVNLRNGSARRVTGFDGRPSPDDFAWWLHRVDWSPDGRWISVVDNNGRIVLLDSDDLSRRKYLGGSSGNAPVYWSPDSKYLLVTTGGLRCALYLYFGSFQTVEVETGKRTEIKGSRCQVGTGWAGWIDQTIADRTATTSDP
jgi:hypothetical protein